MDATTVQTLLDDLLGSTVAVLVAPPARQIVAHGHFSHDCEMCAVKLSDWTLQPVDRPASCMVTNLLTLTTMVLRCYPSARGEEVLPSATEITAASKTLAADLADLTTGLSDRWLAGTLFPNVNGLDDCSQINWIGTRMLGPEGGMAGWELTLTVNT